MLLSLGKKMMADRFCRDELLERLDPTVNKIVGLVRHQVEAVAKERTKLPKVCMPTSREY